MTAPEITPAPESPAVGGPVQRQVRALEPERAAFEAWRSTRYGAIGLSRNNTPGSDLSGYQNAHTQGQWEAWQAARPKRPAIGAIVNVAAELAQRKPLRALEPLTEASRIGRLQMARAYAQADDDTRLLAVKLADAVRAL